MSISAPATAEKRVKPDSIDPMSAQRAVALANRRAARERRARELFEKLGLDHGRIVVVRSSSADGDAEIQDLRGFRLVAREAGAARKLIGPRSRFTVIQMDRKGRVRFRDARAVRQGGELKVIDDRAPVVVANAAETGGATGDQAPVPVNSYIETIQVGSPGAVIVVTVDEDDDSDFVPNEWVEVQVKGQEDDCVEADSSKAAGLFGSDCSESTSPTGPRGDRYGRGVGHAGDSYGRGAGYPWKFGDKVGDLAPAKNRCEKDHDKCEKKGAIYYPKCKSGYKPSGCCICQAEGKELCEKKEGKTCEKCLALWYPKCDRDYKPFGCNICEYSP